jgi:hypothetical protein
MGKKPVLGLIGLVWAGIALTGCGTCQNCNNPSSVGKYRPEPLLGSRKDSPGAGIIPPSPGNSTANGDSRNAGGSPMSKTSDVASTGDMGRGDALPTSGKGFTPSGTVSGGPGGNPMGSGMGNGIPAPPSLPGSPQNVESLRGLQPRDQPGTSGGTPPGQFREMSSATGINGGSDFNRVPVPNPPAASPLNGGPGSRIGELPPANGGGNLPAISSSSSMSARQGASMGSPSVPANTSSGPLPPMGGSSMSPPIPPQTGSPLPPPGN